MDFFIDHSESTGFKPIYFTIVDVIIALYFEKYPANREPTLHLINKINDPRIDFKYELLVGKVQFGKSPVATMAMWILTYKNLHNCVYFTKNLIDLRNDFKSKLGMSMITAVIRDFFDSYECDLAEPEQLIDYFTLKPFDIYSRKNTFSRGDVAIMLYNGSNYNRIIQFYKTSHTLNNGRPTPLTFILDEIQDLYTKKYSIYVHNSGLISRKKKISNRKILSWFELKMHQKKIRCIGITATANNCLSQVPHPNSITSINFQAPIPGYVYFGLETDRVNIVEQYENINLTVQRILDGAHAVYDGNKEIKTILISTKRENVDMLEITRSLELMFGDKILVRILAQDELKNKRNHTTLKSLYQSVKRNITDKVCNEGAIIIIGKGRVGAGITLAPYVVNVNIEHTDSDRQSFKCHGLTDQIVGKQNNMTSDEQLLRVLGVYHEQHRCYLHVLKEDLIYYKEDIMSIKNQLISKYDGTIASVSKILHKATKKIGENYQSAGSLVHLIQDTIPVDKKELDVVFSELDITDPALVGKRIIDLYNERSLQAKLRSSINGALDINEHNLTWIGDGPGRVQVPYTEERLREIMTAVIKPKLTGSNRQWQVNGIVWGDQGIQTPLSESYLLLFKHKYDHPERTQDGTASFFRAQNGKYILLEKHKTSEIVESKEEIEYSTLHYEILDETERNIGDVRRGRRPLNNWDLFRKCCKQEFGTVKYSPLYQRLKSNTIKFTEFTAIKNSFETDHDIDRVIDEGCNLIKPFFTPRRLRLRLRNRS